MIPLILLFLITGCAITDQPDPQHIHITPIVSLNDCAVYGNQALDIDVYKTGYVETSQGETK